MSNISKVRPARRASYSTRVISALASPVRPISGSTSTLATSARYGWFCGISNARVAVPARTPPVQAASRTCVPAATFWAVQTQNYRAMSGARGGRKDAPAPSATQPIRIGDLRDIAEVAAEASSTSIPSTGFA